MKRLATILLPLALMACGGDDGPEKYEVTYRVSALGGITKAMITYRTSFGTSQTTVTLPWSTSGTREQGDFLYVSAQNQGATGTIYTTITANGKSIASGSSSSAYGIATASKTCC